MTQKRSSTRTLQNNTELGPGICPKSPKSTRIISKYICRTSKLRLVLGPDLWSQGPNRCRNTISWLESLTFNILSFYRYEINSTLTGQNFLRESKMYYLAIINKILKCCKVVSFLLPNSRVSLLFTLSATVNGVHGLILRACKCIKSETRERPRFRPKSR
jgi:hypothetical protein